tara:strand:- start:14483 stop:14644 length:162 start_codon:yes stop_codon:yes gene_type:complete
MDFRKVFYTANTAFGGLIIVYGIGTITYHMANPKPKVEVNSKKNNNPRTRFWM